MEDVHVPQDNMLAKVEGLKGPFSCLKYAGLAGRRAKLTVRSQ